MRASDTIARLGGDEFVVLLADCGAARARAIAIKILAALNPMRLSWQGADYLVGASMGIAALPGEMQTPEQWLEAADLACYCAKREGRGTLRFAGLS